MSLMLMGSLFAQQVPLDDPRIAYRGTLYPEVTSEEVIMYRFPKKELFPKDTYRDRPSYPFKAGTSRTGTSIVIKTDSPTLRLKVKYNGRGDNNGSAMCNFAIYENGKFKKYTSVNDHRGVILEINNSNPKKPTVFRILGPASQPLYILQELHIDDGYQLFSAPPVKEKTYVAIGDSISHGLRRDNTYDTWTWKVSDKLGYEFYNLAIGGSITNPDQVRHIHQLKKVDLITWLWGYNDCINRGISVEEYTENMNTCLDIVRAKHPKTPLFILNLLQTKNHKSKKSDFIIDDFREVIEKIVTKRRSQGDDHIHLIESQNYTNKEEDLNDVVHLSTKGHVKLAKAVSEEIRKKILD
jgi:lysophospholipase L1-like esterase